MIPYRRVSQPEEKSMENLAFGIIRRGNQVLLGQQKVNRSTGKRSFIGPSGKIAPGEDPIMCLARETRKDFNVTLSPSKVREVAMVVSNINGMLVREMHVYLTDEFVGIPHGTDGVSLKWYDIEQWPIEPTLKLPVGWFALAVREMKVRAYVYYNRPGEFQRIEYSPL